MNSKRKEEEDDDDGEEGSAVDGRVAETFPDI